MEEEIYGLSEDPWPYEYIINSLLFFSMSDKNRESYFSSISDADIKKYTKQKAVKIIIEGFSEYLPVGRTFDEWIEDEALENRGIEKDFYFFNNLGFMNNAELILKNWKIVRKQSIKILHKIGWEEAEAPFFTCEEILRAYDVHDAGNGWGWYWN